MPSADRTVDICHTSFHIYHEPYNRDREKLNARNWLLDNWHALGLLWQLECDQLMAAVLYDCCPTHIQYPKARLVN